MLKHVVIIPALLLLGGVAYGHPGALDNDDCHVVREDWKYKDGKVLKKGTRHCHSPLNAMSLDGKQLLQDPDDKGEPVKKESKDKKK